MPASHQDAASIVGEECHIVARVSMGPRGSATLTLEERNYYNNLILLCSTHHKLVDDQEKTYTVDKLQQIKTAHEEWVNKLLSSKQQTKPDPLDIRFAFRVDRGNDLLSFVIGSHLFYLENDLLESEEEAHQVGEFLQNIRD